DGLWAQRLHGKTHRFLGPVHGLAGNVHALLQVGGEWSEALLGDAAAVLAREAVVEERLATWPAIAGDSLEGNDSVIRLQWCHGAPGIVATAADYLDEELLLAGAELTWQAGAHGDEKGHGLCHGTAGNGFALLKTFARTGDERWLERARRFAVHALLQAERRRGELGVGRYSLLTGDVGVALFAAGCPPRSASRTAFGNASTGREPHLGGAARRRRRRRGGGGRGRRLLFATARLARQEPPGAHRADRGDGVRSRGRSRLGTARGGVDRRRCRRPRDGRAGAAARGATRARRSQRGARRGSGGAARRAGPARPGRPAG